MAPALRAGTNPGTEREFPDCPQYVPEQPLSSPSMSKMGGGRF